MATERPEPVSQLPVGDTTGEAKAFENLLVELEPRLRRALISSYGDELGQEALAEAFARAWARRERVLAMENPAGWIFVVARNHMRRLAVRHPLRRERPSYGRMPEVEPALAGAVAALSPRQRAVVLLVEGFESRIGEVSELLGISDRATRTHLDRALRSLRRKLGAQSISERKKAT